MLVIIFVLIISFLLGDRKNESSVKVIGKNVSVSIKI